MQCCVCPESSLRWGAGPAAVCPCCEAAAAATDAAGGAQDTGSSVSAAPRCCQEADTAKTTPTPTTSPLLASQPSLLAEAGRHPTALAPASLLQSQCASNVAAAANYTAADPRQRDLSALCSLPCTPVVGEDVPDDAGVCDHDCELGHDAVPGQAREGVGALALPEGVGVLHHLHDAAQEGDGVAGACRWVQWKGSSARTELGTLLSRDVKT